MKFSYGCAQLHDTKIGERNCYLLSNGLGGYSSLTLIGSCTRADHTLLTGAYIAPDLRIRLVSRIDEKIIIDGKTTNLSSQNYVDYTKNQSGHLYLINYTQNPLPEWTYFIDGIELIKRIVLVHNENTLGIQYEIHNPCNANIDLICTPQYHFTSRNDTLQVNQEFKIDSKKIESNEFTLNYQAPCATNQIFDQIKFTNDYYHEYDARDGRSAISTSVSLHALHFFCDKSATFELIYSTTDAQRNVSQLISDEISRQEKLISQSKIKSLLGQELTRAADHYLVKRDSINGLTLMAGYPFFTDWGRDTMITIEGCCIATKRFDETKNILTTFTKYLHNGVMPNMFPEGNNPPLYNTVDASLLFIQAAYLYYQESNDLAYIKEIFEPMQSIIHHYKVGTDFDIKMNEDGLISAGSGLMQLTWMDIRYEDILPTPRHGKPVEINAYWYSALRIMDEFAVLLGHPQEEYGTLAQLVKQSFNEQFWNDEQQCLKDVVSGESCDNQIRCNQIWAVSTPFSPLDSKRARLVVDCVQKYLVTPYGLRSLAKTDPQFISEYSGSLKKRDLSYHQGTTWTFPLGSYFRAYLKVNNYSKESLTYVKRQLSWFSDALYDGCVGHIAEIYDGEFPNDSRGCFAQGWSVGEILKMIAEVEKYE